MRGGRWRQLRLDTAGDQSHRGPWRPQQGFRCYSNGKAECRVSLGEGRWVGKSVSKGAGWEALAVVRTGLVAPEVERRAERPLAPALRSEGQGFRTGQGTFVCRLPAYHPVRCKIIGEETRWAEGFRVRAGRRLYRESRACRRRPQPSREEMVSH